MTRYDTARLAAFLRESSFPLLCAVTIPGFPDPMREVLVYAEMPPPGYVFERAGPGRPVKSAPLLASDQVERMNVSSAAFTATGGLNRYVVLRPDTLADVQEWCAPWLQIPDDVQTLEDLQQYLLAVPEDV